MSKNQSSAQSAVEGELSLDDLEKIAGGINADFAGLAADGEKILGSPQADPTVLKPSDSMFTAVGAKGTDPTYITGGTPMNMTFVR